MAAQYGRPLYIAAVVSVFVFFFSSPILSGRRLDVYYTSTQDVCDRCVTSQCRSEMWSTWLTDNTGREQSPSVQHRTTLSGYIFATKASIDNRKKNLLKSNVSSTCSQQISVGLAYLLRYCTDVAQWRSNKLCMMFGRLLG